MSPVGIIIYLSMCISATYSASIVFLTVIRNQLHTVCCTVANMVVHHQCRFAIHTIMIALIQPVFVAYASCANHYNTSATASCTYHSRANMRIRTTCSLACENGIGDTADAEHYAQREEKEISFFMVISLSAVLYGCPFCQRSSYMECARTKHSNLLIFYRNVSFCL